MSQKAAAVWQLLTAKLGARLNVATTSWEPQKQEPTRKDEKVHVEKPRAYTNCTERRDLRTKAEAGSARQLLLMSSCGSSSE